MNERIKQEVENAIYRGFLSAGVEDVSKTIIKETAQDCLAQIEEQSSDWIKISEHNPLPKFVDVLGYNKEWVEADFNPKGVRVGYLTDEGNFISAKYEPDGEDYISKYEEGDDYQEFQMQKDGTMKTWYNNGDERGNIEGYRPNLPTHYKLIDSPTLLPTQKTMTMDAKNDEVNSVGGGITQFKMSCNIGWDIDKVYDAACWVSGMADFLIKEMQTHHYDTGIFVRALDVQNKANQLASETQRMMWEKKRKFGEQW